MKSHHDYGEPWDASDVEDLIRRRRDRQQTKEIAGQMGRSPEAVKSKIARLRRAGVNVDKGRKQ